MGAARVVAVRWMVIATARHRRPHTRAAVRRPPYPCPVVRAADLPVPSTRLHQQRPAHIHRRAARTRPRRRLHWTNDIRPAPPENPQPDHPDRGHPPLPSHRPRPGYREVPHLRPGPRIALRPRRTRHRHTHPRPSTIRRHRIPHRGRKPHHGSIIRVTKHQPPQPQSNTTEPDPHTTDLTQKSGFAGLSGNPHRAASLPSRPADTITPMAGNQRPRLKQPHFRGPAQPALLFAGGKIPGYPEFHHRLRQWLGPEAMTDSTCAVSARSSASARS